MARFTALWFVLAAAAPAAAQDKADAKRAAELKDRIAAKKAELAGLEAELVKVAPPTEKSKAAAGDAEQKARLYRILLGVTEGDDWAALLAGHTPGDGLSAELKRVNDILLTKFGPEDAKLAEAVRVLTVDAKGKIGAGPADRGVLDAAVAAVRSADWRASGEVAKAQAAAKAADKAKDEFLKLFDALPKAYRAALDEEVKKFDARKALFTQTEAEYWKKLEEAQERAGIAERERERARIQLKAVMDELAKLKKG
ncbi:MAG: hypothetical protein C0501_13920 [Isosphaera sp.]|nr:hypothetical protein [Isosphaera sp.]